MRKKQAELASKLAFSINDEHVMKVTFNDDSTLQLISEHYNSLVNKYLETMSKNTDLSTISKDKILLDQKLQQFEESLSEMNLLTTIGKQITGNLNINNMLNDVFEYVKSSMDVEVVELLYFRNDQEVLLHMDSQGVVERVNDQSDSGVMRWALENNKEVFLNDALNDYAQYQDTPIHSFAKEYPSSIICIPLYLNTNKIGTLSVSSTHKNAYNEYHLEFLRTLASYMSVALDNSRVYSLLERGKAVIEQEKVKSDKLLLNILPAEIAEELKEKGSVEARNFDVVSVLFTDFKGFTPTSKLLSPQKLVAVLNFFFKEFDEICNKYNIEKIKTIGDSYMAAGGIPRPFDGSVKNTILAAIEMSEFNAKQERIADENGHAHFEMRVGVNTGPVVSGIVGVSKFQYDIWGDTVNLASRMESHGEVGKVNISYNTYEYIKDDADFRFEKRGQVETKGAGLVDMYFVSKA